MKTYTNVHRMSNEDQLKWYTEELAKLGYTYSEDVDTNSHGRTVVVCLAEPVRKALKDGSQAMTFGQGYDPTYEMGRLHARTSVLGACRKHPIST